MATLSLNKSEILERRPDLAKMLGGAESKIAKAPKAKAAPLERSQIEISPKAAPAPPAPPVEAKPAPKRYHHHDVLPEAVQALNRERHQAWAEKLDAAEAFLTARCPPFADPLVPMPLAIGIHLVACERYGAEIPKDELCSAISRWCRRPVYLQALQRDGSVRHDLDGRECGAVSERDKLGRTGRNG